MAIVESIAIAEAKKEIAKLCKDGDIPPATATLIEAIITATLKQVKAGQVSTTVVGTCSTGPVTGTGTGKIS